jgi:hypothetical protein
MAISQSEGLRGGYLRRRNQPLGPTGRPLGAGYACPVRGRAGSVRNDDPSLIEPLPGALL